MKREFWPTAWDLERELLSIEPSSPEGFALARSLLELPLQDFVFRHRRWAEPGWFETLDRAGVFSNPPAPESVEGGVIVRRWPALEYLKAISGDSPDQVVARLKRIQTLNSWVISGGLELAASLPPRACADLVQHLLPQWDQVPSQWVPRGLWKRILTNLARVSDSETRISEIVSRLALRVLTRPSGARLNASDIVEATSSQPVKKFVSAIADGIETAILLAAPRGDRPPGYLLRFELDDEERSSQAYPLQTLVPEWWLCVQSELTKYGAGRTAIRAARLVKGPDSFIMGMGLRALRAALNADQSERIAISAFLEVLSRDEIVDDYFLEAELFPLIRSHWDVLPIESRADLEKSWLEKAGKKSSGSLRARDRLGAVRNFLGAGEQVVLQRIESEFGDAVVERELPKMGAMWVGPESPVDDRQLSSMNIADILALMRHTPGPKRGDWNGPSPEGLARTLTPIVAGRLLEWVDVLDEVASDVPYISVQVGVIRGLEEGFKQSSEFQTDLNLQRVTDYFNHLLSRVTNDNFESPNGEFVSTSELVGAMVDWADGMAEWVVGSEIGHTVLPVVERALVDADPTSEDETTFGGDNMNPPTLALNVTRGKGLLAAFSILAKHWGDEEGGAPRLRSDLEKLIESRLGEEKSPSVRSTFGLYLPQIITYWHELWEANASRLLPREADAVEEWSAVFTTYLLFHPARRQIAQELQEHYELGVTRLGSDGARFLTDHGDNLLTHIVVLSIYSDAASEWETLLNEAIESASDETVSAAIGNLESGIRSRNVEVSFEYLRRISSRILARSRREGNFDASLAGIMNLLTATAFPLDVVGGLLLDVLTSGPAPDIDDLTAYLARIDPDGSGMGARILAAAMAAGDVSGMFYSIETIRDAVSRYASAFPDEMRPLIDSLGWQGVYELENEAVVVYSQP